VEGTAENLGIDRAKYSDEEIVYHLKMLIEEGFAAGSKQMRLVTGLTWKGHEFMDTVRDGEIWRQTKETATKVAEHGIPL
jgi:hypothetical protein